MNIELSNKVLAVVYSNCNTAGRQAIKAELGDKLSEILPVTSRVKTFEDACEELGEDHEAVKAYRDIEWKLGKDHKDLLAYLKLRIITTALNEGWQPLFTQGERRWYAWYDLVTPEQIEAMDDEERCRVVGRAVYDAGACGGLVFSNASYVSTDSFTNFGSRLAFKDEELAEYAGKQFIDIYADFCFIPATKEHE